MYTTLRIALIQLNQCGNYSFDLEGLNTAIKASTLNQIITVRHPLPLLELTTSYYNEILTDNINFAFYKFHLI